MTVPASVAAEVLRRLVRDIVTEARGNGGQPSPTARRLLHALYEAAQLHRHASATRPGQRGTVPGEPGLSVRETADLMGCSPQWVRHLLATGRLTGRRSGGVWVVHPNRPLATPQADLPVA
ncbi:hypothetical protein [Crossiella sp. CA198]|uniref:helix-turn-helix domain-containing protein n=1 Tax=Crossiella sp. CA198 TaxID=3455607 RepID=UPI003F8CFB62